jgi:hypothetical protein
MKYLFIVLVLLSSNVYAAAKSWDELKLDSKALLLEEIVLTKNTFTVNLPKNSLIKLQERISMPMIKVDLFKFDISKYCSDDELTTDIQLIDIKQNDGSIIIVGADIAEDCLMEVFIESKDIYSTSIFN